MDKVDQLLIRACKVENPEKRFLSIYKRFWLFSTDSQMALSVITDRLMKICEEYEVGSLIKYVNWHRKQEIWHKEGFIEKPFQQKLLEFCVDSIRYTGVDSFPGLSIPIRFRR